MMVFPRDTAFRPADEVAGSGIRLIATQCGDIGRIRFTAACRVPPGLIQIMRLDEARMSPPIGFASAN